MFNIGPTELLVILLIALVVFGPKRLPEIGKTVGKSLREFRKATDDIKSELNLSADEDGNDDPFTGTFPTSDTTATTPASTSGGATEGPTEADPAKVNGQVPEPQGSEATGTGS
jgi:sec-independent protein translocase protein TatA